MRSSLSSFYAFTPSPTSDRLSGERGMWRLAGTTARIAPRPVCRDRARHDRCEQLFGGRLRRLGSIRHLDEDHAGHRADFGRTGTGRGEHERRDLTQSLRVERPRLADEAVSTSRQRGGERVRGSIAAHDAGHSFDYCEPSWPEVNAFLFSGRQLDRPHPAKETKFDAAPGEDAAHRARQRHVAPVVVRLTNHEARELVEIAKLRIVQRKLRHLRRHALPRAVQLEPPAIGEWRPEGGVVSADGPADLGVEQLAQPLGEQRIVETARAFDDAELRAPVDVSAVDGETRADRAVLHRRQIPDSRLRRAEKSQGDREQVVRRREEAAPIHDAAILGGTATERRTELASRKPPTRRGLEVLLWMIDGERLERWIARQHRGRDDRFDDRRGAMAAETRVERRVRANAHARIDV